MKLAKSSGIIHRAAAGAALATIVLFSSGCFLVAVGAGAGAGAGAVAYVEGKLTVTLNNGYDSVGAATNRAIPQLLLIKISEKKDAFTDTFAVRTANDKKVSIVLTKTGDRLTKVEIRVGIFGDKGVSESILDKIRANL